MRRVRGAKKLVEYLAETGTPMSESTIYRLIRTKGIPHIKPTERILIFDLDAIDNWLSVANASGE
ncbi:helix-turn-helix transcriptional regulator [Solibacillus cecembensis]|uniref:helix-turn-helix transcriptional regulator n=1 Tax=Solibacillus cecembensis TaxID=459347 RepID=UPI003CFE324C